MEYKIIVVGIGPGSVDYLLPAGQKAINSATILVGSKRALDSFARPGTITKVIDKDIASVMEFIKISLKTGNVVVMVSGDPGYYSLLPALRNIFTAEKITVIPGISSVQLAFARLALPWHDATLVSMHGRTPDVNLLTYPQNKKLGILTDSIFNSNNIAKLLLESGWPDDSNVWLCLNLSYENEQLYAMSLKEAAVSSAHSHCVMVVIGK